MIKPIFIFLGFLSLGLGGAGIILPGLPTTPFVLLSAGLFLRSSDTLYQKLQNNRIFGKYIRQYKQDKGMSLRVKIVSILMMWSMISLSACRISHLHFRISLMILGLVGTIVMGFVVKTVKPGDQDVDKEDIES